MEGDSDVNCELPKQNMDNSNEAMRKLIPIKSKERYEQAYKEFSLWKILNHIELVNEDVMLAYMLHLSEKLNSSSSLWSKYSMIKSMLLVNENVNISHFCRVTAFIKKQSIKYGPNQSKTLTRDDVKRFIMEASDEEHLLTKVVAMIGIAGDCRREELYNMSIDDVEDNGSQLVITIPQTETNLERVFTVVNEREGINFVEMYRKYIALRPRTFGQKVLFIGYRKGRCVPQRVGINTIGGMSNKIAKFLGLANPEMYTGHCFRCTTATPLPKANADVSVLKRHGEWKRNSVAEKYIEDSIESKNKITRTIQGGQDLVQVTQRERKQEVCLTPEVSIGSEEVKKEVDITIEEPLPQAMPSCSQQMSKSPSPAPVEDPTDCTTSSIGVAVQKLSEISDKLKEDDVYDQFGKYISAELRQLPTREAILLQQQLQNAVIQFKLSLF